MTLRGASFSPCGLYRYSLTRSWEPTMFAGPLRIAWVMLNPSTADAARDDPTIRRVLDFSRREGANAVEIVNLFAFRATDPRWLCKATDPVGRDNNAAIRFAAAAAHRVVCAWGHRGSLARRDVDVATMLDGVALECLGVNDDGSPRHPLYLRADTPLVPFRRPEPAP